MKKITDYAHDILQRVEKKKRAIDFTCGNGNDTFFLGHHFNEVYAFDIQEGAIDQTKNQCRFLHNLEVIHDSHENFHRYVKHFDAGIFNLGYLPNGDKTITTDYEVVIKTLDKALLYLRSGGRMVLVLYPGYEYGKKEAEEIESYMHGLDVHEYDVHKTQLLNRDNAPYIISIYKH